MKIRQVGAKFFHADRRKDGQIDKTKLIIAFRYFANALKIHLPFKKSDFLLPSLQQPTNILNQRGINQL